MRIEPYWRTFVAGKTQSGKSYFARWIVQRTANFVFYDVKKESGHLGAVVTDLAGLDRAVGSGVRKIVYQPEDVSDEHFDLVCAFIRRRLRNVLFVVDEVHLFATKSYIPPNFKWIITVGQGEPHRIGVLAITQRPANTHNDIIGNSSVVVAFKLLLRHDSKAIEDFTGIPSSDIQSLAAREFIVFTDEEGVEPIQKFSPL